MERCEQDTIIDSFKFSVDISEFKKSLLVMISCFLSTVCIWTSGVGRSFRDPGINWEKGRSGKHFVQAATKNR